MNNRILVVDDEKSIRFALTSYFTQNGFRVDSAGDGREARALIAASEYALAIVDIHLSGRNDAGEDGLDLAAFLHEHAPETAVVILTGLESPESLRRADACGVRSFLKKPAPLAAVAEIAYDLLRKSA